MVKIPCIVKPNEDLCMTLLLLANANQGVLVKFYIKKLSSAIMFK